MSHAQEQRIQSLQNEVATVRGRMAALDADKRELRATLDHLQDRQADAGWGGRGGGGGGGGGGGFGGGFAAFEATRVAGLEAEQSRQKAQVASATSSVNSIRAKLAESHEKQHVMEVQLASVRDECTHAAHTAAECRTGLMKLEAAKLEPRLRRLERAAPGRRHHANAAEDAGVEGRLQALERRAARPEIAMELAGSLYPANAGGSDDAAEMAMRQWERKKAAANGPAAGRRAQG